ncbi:hypothetical protein BH20ACT7_BH20ACT7_17720 [soil metagenome]
MSTPQQSPAAAFWDAHYGRPPGSGGRPNAVGGRRDCRPPARDGARPRMRRGSRCHLARAPGLARHRRRRIADCPRSRRLPRRGRRRQARRLAAARPRRHLPDRRLQPRHGPVPARTDRPPTRPNPARGGSRRRARRHPSSCGSRLLAAPGAAPGAQGAFPDPAETARTIGLHDRDWLLVTCELRERPTTDPSGEPATVSDSIIKGAPPVNARPAQAIPGTACNSDRCTRPVIDSALPRARC